MKKIIIRVFGVLLVLLLITAVVVVEFIAPYAVIMPFKMDVTKEKERFPNGFLPSDYQLKFKKLDLLTVDSVRLSNYLILSEGDSSLGTVVMLHGIGGCKEDYLGTAKGLAAQGYDCLIYDARAHGQSGGKYCTYGYHEKEDVRTVVTAILKNNPTTKIGLWASSMGGAVALQALAIEPSIQFGIIESTFTKLPEIVYQYQKRYCYGIGLRFVSNRVLYKAGQIADFDPFEIEPIKACQKIEQNILMNHGDADPNINIQYGKLLFDALKTNNKEFYLVKGGGHCNLYQIGGKPYYDNVLNFMALNFQGE